MEIDWPKTITAGGLTAALLASVYLADTFHAWRLGEPGTGIVPLVGMSAGLLVGLFLANVLLA